MKVAGVAPLASVQLHQPSILFSSNLHLEVAILSASPGSSSAAAYVAAAACCMLLLLHMLPLLHTLPLLHMSNPGFSPALTSIQSCFSANMLLPTW